MTYQDEAIFELKKQCSEVDLENKRLKLEADQAELAERERLLALQKERRGSATGEALLGSVNRDKYDESLVSVLCWLVNGMWKKDSSFFCC